MKKQLVSLFAMACMVFASSCSQEEIVSQSTGNEVAVTFTANLRNDVKSRAVGDDTDNVDQLVFAVYDKNGKELQELRQSTHMQDDDAKKAITLTDNGVMKEAKIEVVLVKGQTYSFAFWAQKKGHTAYSFDPETAKVEISYQNTNDKSADAFFASVTNHKVTGTFEKNVTLKRPFAQINFLTTAQDLKDAAKSEFTPSQSQIVVKNAATELNVLDGTVSGNTDVTFGLAGLVGHNLDNANVDERAKIKNNGQYVGFTNTGTFPLVDTEDKAEPFIYLATAYFLPTVPTASTEIDASVLVKATGKDDYELAVTKVKAQRNYRTNIYGNLLTSNGTFYVTVDPGFVDDYSYEEEDETTKVVGTIAEANALFAEGETNVTITEDPDQGEESTIKLPKTSSAATVNFAFADNATPNVTIQYADNAADGEKPANIEVNGNAGDLVINAPNSTVALNGEYTNVTATTAANTLIVTKGSKITNLILNAGSAEIYYGAVTTLKKAKGYAGSITWTVDSKEQLAQIATDVNAGMKFEKETIKLISDIDLENEEWTPIGLNGKRFMGTFDGQGHIISNFKITTTDNGAQAALFGDVNIATITDFTIDNAQILYPAGYTGDFYGAAVVSQAYMVTLEKITVKNSTIQGNNKVAAILAHDADGASMIIEDCHVVDCTIETKNEADGGNAAGIVGSIEGNRDITKQTKSIKNSSVKNTVFNVVNSTDTGKRSNAQMVGTVIAYEQTLVTLENCVVEGNTFNQTGVTTYKTPYDGVFVGGARNDEAGKVVVNGKEYPIMPAYIGTTGYKSLALALAASNDDDEILLTPGEHELSDSSVKAARVTIKGENKETVIVKLSKSIYLSNKSITLSNLTYITPTGLNYNEQAFAFIHHATAFDLNGCIVNGNLRLNVKSANISDCAFNITTSDGFDGYSLFYYGNNESTVNVSESTFATAGKAIVIYSESAKEYDLNVDGCTFTSSNSSTDKAAIQMHSEYGISGTLTVNNSTATGFANVNNGLWYELNNNTKKVKCNFVKTIDGVATNTFTVPENNSADVVLSTGIVNVTVPVDAASAGADYKIEVKDESTTTNSTTGETTVAFDLTMYKDDVKVSGTTVYAITKNIGTGLFISEVTHNGTALEKATTGADQTYTYDSATGVLTIYTASFSPFAVTYTNYKDYERKLNVAHNKNSTISVSTGADFLPIVAVNPEIYGYSVYDGDTRITDKVIFRFSDVKKETISDNSYKVSVDLAIKDDKGNELEIKDGRMNPYITTDQREHLHVYMNLIEVPAGYSISQVKVSDKVLTLTNNPSGNCATLEYWIGSEPKDLYFQSRTAGLIEVTLTK